MLHTGLVFSSGPRFFEVAPLVARRAPEFQPEKLTWPRAPTGEAMSVAPASTAPDRQVWIERMMAAIKSIL